MFYKKGETDAEDDEQIISGIDEDLGESDPDVAIEPVSISKMEKKYPEKKAPEKKV